MNVREWALVTFSILAQMSVGSFVLLGLVHAFAQRKAGTAQADRFSDMALLAIGPILGLGLVASLLHLGNPLNAYKAVTNWGTSWLSREILCGVLFAATGFAFAFLQWRKIGNPTLRTAVAVAAALIGLALVYSMSNVYLLPTVPAWNTLATPISFFITTFLLGSLALGVAFMVNYFWVQRKDPGCAEAQCSLLRDTLRWIALASLVLLGLEFLVLPLQVAALAAQPGPAAASAAMLIGPFGVLFALRLALVFGGVGLLGMFIYQVAGRAGKENSLALLTYSAFLLVLVAEVLGRYLFYATFARVGV